MQKGRRGWWSVVFVLSLFFVFASAWVAYAAATFSDPAVNVGSGATVVLPAQVPSDPIHQIFNMLIPLILTGLTALLAWLSTAARNWISKVAASHDTGESSQFYSLAFNLAGMAVKYAETKFGADSAQGVKKKQEAANWLKQRLIAVDPTILAKTPNLDSLIDGLVDAAYHDVFEAVRPLAGVAAQ